MALENYTGNIADLVATNPTPTDPKSQGDDHLRGIKYTLKHSFPNFDGPTTQLPGQVTPDTVTLGDNAPASGNHFWDGSVANQLTLKRGTPDAPGTTILTFDTGQFGGHLTSTYRFVGQGAIYAACLFDGTLTGTNPPIAGFGITSVTRNSAGSYTVNFGGASANNAFIVTLLADNGAINVPLWASATNSSIDIRNYVAGILADAYRMHVIVTRGD